MFCPSVCVGTEIDVGKAGFVTALTLLPSDIPCRSIGGPSCELIEVVGLKPVLFASSSPVVASKPQMALLRRANNILLNMITTTMWRGQHNSRGALHELVATYARQCLDSVMLRDCFCLELSTNK